MAAKHIVLSVLRELLNDVDWCVGVGGSDDVDGWRELPVLVVSIADEKF